MKTQEKKNYGMGAYLLVSWPESQEFVGEDDCIAGEESGDVLVPMDEFEFDDDEIEEDCVYLKVSWPESQELMGRDERKIHYGI